MRELREGGEKEEKRGEEKEERKGENTEGERGLGEGEGGERERESVLRIRFYASTEKFRGVEYVTLSFGHVQRERKESTVLDEWPLIFRK